ncbi:MAG: Holliday junction resolvase RuvX [Acidobacteriota bacterium]
MRALGIDFGERRIGLAIGDDATGVAVPLDVIERTTDRRAVYQIADLSRREDIDLLVVGEPRDRLDPTAPRAEVDRVHRFGAKLEKATRLPVRFLDETLTTVEAEARLEAAGDGRTRRGDRLDAVAAQVLLQEALELGLQALGLPCSPETEE